MDALDPAAAQQAGNDIADEAAASRAVTCLASDRAGYVIGSRIRVDGGS